MVRIAAYFEVINGTPLIVKNKTARTDARIENSAKNLFLVFEMSAKTSAKPQLAKLKTSNVLYSGIIASACEKNLVYTKNTNVKSTMLTAVDSNTTFECVSSRIFLFFIFI